MKRLVLIASLGAALLSTPVLAEDTGPALERFRAAYEAGRGLSSAERARLRAVDAYRPAFEALPNSAAASAAGDAGDERWRALAGTAKRLASERRLPRLYDLVLDSAIELAAAERGYLVMKDADGQPRVRSARGDPDNAST